MAMRTFSLVGWLFIAGCQAATVAAPVPEKAATAEPTVLEQPHTLEKLLALAYLDPSTMGGARYCLDPDAPSVAAAFAGDGLALDTPLDARALADDLDVLRDIFERIYPGYPELMQHPTFAVGAFFDEWQRELTGGPPAIHGSDVLEKLAILRAELPDRHMRPAGGSVGKFFRGHPSLGIAEYSSAAPASLLTACRSSADRPRLIEDTLRTAPQLDAQGALTDVLFASGRGDGQMLSLACQGGSLVLQRRAQPARRPDPPLYEWTKIDDAAVITIGRLWGGQEEEATLTRIAADAPLHKKAKLIVMDLRQNGGGNDGYVWAWLRETAHGRYEGSTDVASAAGLGCLGWNHLVAGQLWDKRRDEPAAQAERAALKQKLATGVQRSRPRVNPAVDVFDAKDPFTGRVFVLVDSGTASSGESSALALAGAMGATIVGERSGGYFEYGDVGRFVLPRTALAWDIPTKRNYVTPSVEGVGLAVDVYLTVDLVGAPVKDLLPLLRKLPARDVIKSRLKRAP